MIKKKQSLIKLTSKNKISLITIKLEADLDEYTITQERNSIYNEKVKSKVIENGTTINYNDAISHYKKCIKEFIFDNYLEVDCKKRTEDEYRRFYLKVKKINHPRVIEPYTANNYANKILERDWYCYPVIGENVIIMLDNKGYCAYTKNGERIPLELSEKLKEFIFTNDLKLEAMYKQTLNGKEFYVIDYISDTIYKDRLQFLQTNYDVFPSSKSNDFIQLLLTTKISGSMAIMEYAKHIIRDGMPGIVLCNPNKPYKEGECSTFLRIFIGTDSIIESKVIDHIDQNHVIVDTGKKYIQVYTKDRVEVGEVIRIQEYDERYYGFKINYESSTS